MNLTTTPRLRRATVSAAVLFAGALAVTGCAGTDSDSGSTAGSRISSSATAGSGGATTTAATNDALAAAVATARDAVGSGTVISVEQEQNGTAWEVLVVTADHAEHEVHTDASGEETTGTPRVDDSDTEDRAENQRFVDAAEIDVVDAAGRLQDTVAGTVTELGLDDHAGAVVWEGDVRDSSGTKHSIRIDAGSGDVVTNTVDTDD
ncbi:PepSY domain-containing protein [Curtobacterium sp. ZW137]|uniref:PepSY domain-containing protein n=1 Tax=Curtobacterium sp. ZW137 TaxID=2485104 RepID=UPI000F4C93CF|nr:PepSY domain-containing protein [Curtobacterium sp. ZW137]ROP60452.1 peptidase YpeB-like protein [Curtobacterium sp. ZW137]